MEPIDHILALLTKVLREPSSRKETVKEFERVYDSISTVARRSLRREVLDILDELSYELGYYVADPAMRAQDPSYYGDERLVKEVESTLRLLSQIRLAVPPEDVSEMPDEESMRAKHRPALVEESEQVGAAGSGLFIAPESHRAAMLEGLRQAERGDLVSDDDIEKLWKKCGL